MMERIAEASPRPNARIIGVIYLLYFVTAISGELFIRRLGVSSDPAATANNILTHEPSLRLGFAVGLIGTALYVAMTAIFYDLFKPVNRLLALLATFFSLVGCAIQAFGSLFQIAPLAVLGGDPYLKAFKGEQLQALALMSFKLNAQASSIQRVFFGLFDFLIGYLIFRSTFLPRILGALMAFAGVGWLTCLSPPLAHYLTPYIEILGFLAEALLLLWLLVIGVNAERWKEQAGTAEADIQI